MNRLLSPAMVAQYETQMIPGETPTKTLSQLRAVFSGRLLTGRWTETCETDDGGPRVFF
jgi:hypothetical protein